jgi:hypothetical protein
MRKDNDWSISNILHQRPVSPSPIKIPIKDLLPRPKIQLPLRFGDDHFTPHDLAFKTRVSIVLSRAIVMI